MKIAIHHREGSYSSIWIDYCNANNIAYKVVDCFDNDIVTYLKGCDVLMWHHHEASYKEVLTAKRILFAVEHAGIKVYPNFKTGWHYDDKVSQKYLLEAVNAPVVPNYVFYDQKTAIDWATRTDYPKVFKLKGGAGASNVKLVKTKKESFKLINKAFGRGFSQFNRWRHLKEGYNKFRAGQDTLLGVLKGVGRLVIPTDRSKFLSREKNYAYFQKFIPNNEFDIRIVVVGNKAIGERRFVRKNDFRASGSGKFDYDGINSEVIKIAFETAKKLNVQSVAFDFVYDDKQPLIVEISYAFGVKGILKAPGYWTSDLDFHEKEFDPRVWIIKEIIAMNV